MSLADWLKPKGPSRPRDTRPPSKGYPPPPPKPPTKPKGVKR